MECGAARAVAVAYNFTNYIESRSGRSVVADEENFLCSVSFLCLLVAISLLQCRDWNGDILYTDILTHANFAPKKNLRHSRRVADV